MLTAPLLATILLVASPGATEPATTQTTTRPAVSADLRAEVDTAITRSLKRLTISQRPDGGWKGFGESSDPAISSLIAKCFVQDPAYGPRHPVVRNALKFVLASKQDDGGIYGDATVKNYSTSVALMFLAAMNDPALEREIAAQQQYLKQGQWIEDKTDNDDKTITTAHPWYGGVGYGQHKRPDLSNTQMMLEALHQSGLPSTDPVYQRALVFIARCQMCSETNDQPFAAKGRDGGFIYTPANGGESKAGFETFGDDQILRSYGSMTYAGFKSMLYAGVDRDDLRVQLAWKWIRSNYTLDANPNMPGKQSLEGLYYYLHVFAKALAAWGEPVVVDITGTSHDWRADLCRKLLAEQKPDGSWLNAADRWMEGNPDLVSAYAILALQEAVR
ncbi:MAG: terpene cyclase/mutase family protein [Phycisphaerae bacterium]|nr:terpene cyclase/mutase family protein [Phycisphaerae bacterium]